MSVNIVVENGFDEVEHTNEFAGLFGEFRLAGHGDVTNVHCGTFKTYLGCNRVELHNKITLDGVNHKGKVFVKKIFNSCDRPSCPICYKYGWAIREAGEIENRLAEASKRFGKVDHIVASVPVRDYILKFESLRKKVVDILFVRGVIGGVLIFHRDRFSRRKGWFVSPHFHILGFILGGYSCRGCKKLCSAHDCDGFEGRTRRQFVKDGYIVKVLGERKTVGGTAWYQLNHSSYRIGVERSNVATWFGCCSYRKLKVTTEIKRAVCPICQHDLEELRYSGGNADILACYGSDRRSCGALTLLADAVEDGRDVWSVVVKHGFGGYE